MPCNGIALPLLILKIRGVFILLFLSLVYNNFTFKADKITQYDLQRSNLPEY